MRSLLVGVTALLMAMLLPAYLLPEPEAMPAQTQVLIIREETEETQTPQEQTVLLDTGQGVEEISLQRYLTGVLLAEMPASFEPEALKAQAVAARTFALRRMQQGKHWDCDLCASGSCCQAWLSEAAVKEKLGSTWESYWKKAADAVEATADMVLRYQGQLIDAVYFSCSGGMTEDAAAVWGSSVPYLQPVSSPGEESASRYQSQVRIPLQQFRTMLEQENKAVRLEANAAAWFGEAVYSAGNGVYSMEIGGQAFMGTRLRQLFGLNSTCFTVAVERDAVIFEVTGYGHRVGMSQYGANAMARQGKSFEEILLHYYTGVELVKWE